MHSFTRYEAKSNVPIIACFSYIEFEDPCVESLPSAMQDEAHGDGLIDLWDSGYYKAIYAHVYLITTFTVEYYVTINNYGPWFGTTII